MWIGANRNRPHIDGTTTQGGQVLDTESQCNTNRSDVSKEHAAIDGGYGWMVVLGSYIAHLVIGQLP